MSVASRTLGERTRLACWFRHPAETIFPSALAAVEEKRLQRKVRDREDALASTGDACTPQTRNLRARCIAHPRAIPILFCTGRPGFGTGRFGCSQGAAGSGKHQHRACSSTHRARSI